MSSKKPFQPDDKQLRDEVKLIQLLEQHAKLVEEVATDEKSVGTSDDTAALDAKKREVSKLEDQIVSLIDEHFRDALRPGLLKVFGPGVIDPNSDAASICYTIIVNDFFTKVLAERHDAFWRAKTAKQLRTWSSVVMANQIRDYFRRKKLAPTLVDDIGTLADSRRVHFEKNNELSFEWALETIKQWREGSDPDFVLKGLVLQHRYIDGMPYDEIADQLDISKEKLYRVAEEAKKLLRIEHNRRVA